MRPVPSGKLQLCCGQRQLSKLRSMPSRELQHNPGQPGFSELRSLSCRKLQHTSRHLNVCNLHTVSSGRLQHRLWSTVCSVLVVRVRKLHYRVGVCLMYVLCWRYVRNLGRHDVSNSMPGVRCWNLFEQQHGPMLELSDRHLQHGHGYAVCWRLPSMRRRHVQRCLWRFRVHRMCCWNVRIRNRGIGLHTVPDRQLQLRNRRVEPMRIMPGRHLWHRRGRIQLRFMHHVPSRQL